MIIPKQRFEFRYVCAMQIYGFDVSNKFYISYWDLKSRKIVDKFIFYFK
jgi:hypothetical protein